jgi:hypothetical protein
MKKAISKTSFVLKVETLRNETIFDFQLSFLNRASCAIRQMVCSGSQSLARFSIKPPDDRNYVALGA